MRISNTSHDAGKKASAPNGSYAVPAALHPCLIIAKKSKTLGKNSLTALQLSNGLSGSGCSELPVHQEIQ